MAESSYDSNPILRLTFQFSLDAMAYCELLNAEKKFALANQLFRSATSIGANANEAQDAESKADFIHKFKVAAKEVRETKYWLALCRDSGVCPNCDHVASKLLEIEKIINKIIGTSKGKGG